MTSRGAVRRTRGRGILRQAMLMCLSEAGRRTGAQAGQLEPGGGRRPGTHLLHVLCRHWPSNVFDAGPLNLRAAHVHVSRDQGVGGGEEDRVGAREMFSKEGWFRG